MTLAAHISTPLSFDKVMARNPTLMGTTMGFKFYEHPVHGDESPMIISDGTKCGISHYWEVPSIEEMIWDNPMAD